MKLFVVEREEFSGYDCDGHWQNYLVAASNMAEASEQLPNDTIYAPNRVRELKLPKLERLRKPRVIV